MHVISEIGPAMLIQRRQKVLETMEYLREERFGLERSASLMDADAYRRRASLLETVAAWYDEETAEINNALG